MIKRSKKCTKTTLNFTQSSFLIKDEQYQNLANEFCVKFTNMKFEHLQNLRDNNTTNPYI